MEIGTWADDVLSFLVLIFPIIMHISKRLKNPQKYWNYIKSHHQKIVFSVFLHVYNSGNIYISPAYHFWHQTKYK